MAGIAVDVPEVLVAVALRPAGDVLPNLDQQHLSIGEFNLYSAYTYDIPKLINEGKHEE